MLTSWTYNKNQYVCKDVVTCRDEYTSSKIKCDQHTVHSVWQEYSQLGDDATEGQKLIVYSTLVAGNTQDNVLVIKKHVNVYLHVLQ